MQALKKFYVDTSIWIDLFEDRIDSLRPLGEFAFQFFKKCSKHGFEIIYSDIVIVEMKSFFCQMKEAIGAFGLETKKVEAEETQKNEAENISALRKLPLGDCLHAVIARDNNAVLITRDFHFSELKDIVETKKPEEVIF